MKQIVISAPNFSPSILSLNLCSSPLLLKKKKRIKRKEESCPLNVDYASISKCGITNVDVGIHTSMCEWNKFASCNTAIHSF